MTEEEKLIAKNFRACFHTDSGKKTLEVLEKFCYGKQNPYVESSFDRTAYNCGRLSVLLLIKKYLENPEHPVQNTNIHTGLQL
ncbi:MAG TPA: hypothetical protein PLV55_06075 [Anaerohalosphaeraceae bacterium]|nr:hypothetical protein [Anaerohalosphaeraceae bacterium]